MKKDKHNKTLKKIEFLGRASMLFAVYFALAAFYESSVDLFNSALSFFLFGTLGLFYVWQVKVVAKKRAKNAEK